MAGSSPCSLDDAAAGHDLALIEDSGLARRDVALRRVEPDMDAAPAIERLHGCGHRARRVADLDQRPECLGPRAAGGPVHAIRDQRSRAALFIQSDAQAVGRHILAQYIQWYT